MRTISALATIAILRGLFARLGMPTLVVNDNGTQFTSAEFVEFCAMNSIQHVTTAPYHPQSNGQAERFVDTFKRAIKKIREGRDTKNAALDTFLLTYRSTLNRSAPEGKSPSEVMFSRKLRTCLELLRPPAACAPATESADNNKHRFFNRADPVFVQVHVRNSWRWASGVVVERIGTVMYNVWVEERRMLRSHINQMRSRAGLTPTVGQPVALGRPFGSMESAAVTTSATFFTISIGKHNAYADVAR
ncbi:uncharacterized protein K02A2.6-like [Topomyia yanbarensis]|uniref:uncharacterized protein K02A2.6-like n=1 Tax=Topomyia yanbarensis TaxID=2498891 RepID=UPI00273CB243|nr:uncharacterized protein K02A2.6-like [Topomyia yanbarensis]